MFSSDSARQADACRFCWMCRHICPVAAATGNEAWTPRARGLMISMAERGAAFEESAADLMYKCALCDACANDCVTGYRPGDFIREARTYAVTQGIAPARVTEGIENQARTGRITGRPVAPALAEALAALPRQGEVLLLLGETAPWDAPETALAAVSLLQKAGVSLAVLPEEPPTGALLSELEGWTGDVQAQAQALDEAVRAAGAHTVAALDPHDGAILLQQYPQWGLLPGVRAVTVTAYLAELVRQGRLSVRKTTLRAALHEPCRLTRGLDESAPVRDLLEALGVELTELFLHGKLTRCCGGPVLDWLSPEVTAPMARARTDDARRLDADTVITACPACLGILRRYGGLRILDLLALLDENT